MELIEALGLPDGTRVRAKPSEGSPYWYGTVTTSRYYGRGIQFENICVETHGITNVGGYCSLGTLAEVLLKSLEVVEGG